MQRIAIIGNAGGGKSVLARKLGSRLDLPVFQFDDLQWQPGWLSTPEDEIRSTHSGWTAQSRWIIDGWGNPEILKERFSVADTIIFVDLPIPVHYWWATKRQIKAILKFNQGWPPEGCAAFPITGRLYKLMWKIHKEMRPQLIDLIYQYTQDLQIIHFGSASEIKFFLQNIAAYDLSEIDRSSG